MPPPRKCPRVLNTLGDHLRQARLLRGLMQTEVAEVLGVGHQTVLNWERNHTTVSTRYIPQVVTFLGYDPRQESDLLGDRIRVLRERQGLSQVGLAAKLGVNASTVTRWELGRVKKLFPTVRRRFEEFLSEG